MIFYNKNENNKEILIEKTKDTTSQSFTLKLHSVLRNVDYSFDGLTNLTEMYNYFKFSVDLSDMENGEYKYTLINEDGAEETNGLLKIVDGTKITNDYNTTVKYNEYRG